MKIKIVLTDFLTFYILEYLLIFLFYKKIIKYGQLGQFKVQTQT